MREHTAVVVIPFTLCSLLLCNDMTGERAGVAQSPPPRRPGLPAVNRRFAVPSAHSFRLIGYGRRQRPCKAALSAHPCASPRPEGKRLSDLQPDRGIADSPQSFRKQLYCFCIKNYWGSLSPQGEGKSLPVSEPRIHAHVPVRPGSLYVYAPAPYIYAPVVVLPVVWALPARHWRLSKTLSTPPVRLTFLVTSRSRSGQRCCTG